MAAKDINDDIYARACATINGVTYYSDVVEYSVEKYVESMREKGNLTEAQETLFAAMLEYGAAAQAVEMSGIAGTIDPFEFGVYFGSGIGGFTTFVEEHDTMLNRGAARVSPHFVPKMISNIAAGQIAIRYGAKGPCLSVVTACATGTNAIGEAYRAVKHGYCTAAITGGAEASIHPLAVAGFSNMTALTTESDPERASIPFDKNRSAIFKSLLKNLAKSIDSRNVNAELENLLKDPGITIDKDGLITVDASKLANKAIAECIFELAGTQSLAIPDKIDRKTYDSLMSLKQDPARKAYLDSIRPRLSEASYNAAVSRLDDVIAHAEKLGNEGKIVEENGWTQVQEQPLATGKLPVRKLNGSEKQLGGFIATKTNSLCCPSYFAREKIDKLF